MILDSRIPELNTTLTQPVHSLEKHFFSHCETIREWFHAQWKLTPPPVYGSVDLRNAGFKLAPIDMNLFPAGFNNLNPAFFPLSVKAAKKAIHAIVPNAKRILVIPEGHTRNLFYWSNVNTLRKILAEGGFEVHFGLLDETINSVQEIKLPTDEVILVEPLIRNQDQLTVAGFQPDIVLLNNDLSDGIPAKNIRC